MAEIDWESGEIKQPEGATADTDWEQGEIKPPPEPKGFLGHARDLGLSAVKSAIALPEAYVGLADIPAGGRIGKFLENEGGAIGFRPKQAKEFLSEFHTDAYKDQQRQFQEADGILDKTAVALENPSLILNPVVESVAPMVGGAGLARKVLTAAPKLGAAAAGAIGEGTMMAGSQASAIRQETDDGLLTAGQSGAAVATGLAGTLFGYLGGRVAQRFGFGDIDTMIARGANPQGVASEIASLPAKSVPRQVIEGAITEGFLEELPQSVAEQIIQNLALGKQWSEGVEDAAVMGTLAGMAMGGGASLYNGMTRPEAPTGEVPPPATGAEPPAATPQGFTPTAERPVIDEAALGRAGIFPPAPAPIINERALEPAPTPSQQMGLDPAAGPMSAAAALAVDTGASATMQQAAQAVDPETGEILETAPAGGEQAQIDQKPAGGIADQMEAAVRSGITGDALQAQISKIMRDGDADDVLTALKDRPDLDSIAQIGLSEPAWSMLRSDLLDARGVAPEDRSIFELGDEPVAVKTENDWRFADMLDRLAEDEGWLTGADAERALGFTEEDESDAIEDDEGNAGLAQADVAGRAQTRTPATAPSTPAQAAGEGQEELGQFDVSGRTPEQLQYLASNGQTGWKEAAQAELQRRAAQPAAAVQPTQAPTAPEQSRPAPSPRSESAQQSAVGGPAEDLRRQLREVEDKIIAAAPGAMGAGGGDIEAAMKSRKVPITLKAQRKRLKDQLRQASQGEQSQNAQPAQVDATSDQGSGAVPAGSAGDAPVRPVDIDRVDRPAGAPAPGSRARVPVGTAGAQQPAGVEGATDTAAPAAQPAAPRFDSQSGATRTQAERDLWERGADSERTESDVGVTAGTQVRFVPLADAVATVREAEQAGVAMTPFQVHQATGIRVGDAERVIREAQAPEQARVQEGAAAGSGRTAALDSIEQQRIENATVSVSLTPESAAETRINRKISAAGNPAEKARLQGYYDFLRGMPSKAKEQGTRLEVSYQQGWNKGKNLRENILKGKPWYETDKRRDGNVWKWDMHREGVHVASGEAKSEKAADQAIEDAKIAAMESRGDFKAKQGSTSEKLAEQPTQTPMAPEQSRPSQRSESAQPEFTTLKDRSGKTVTVRTADLSSARERMPMFTKDGKRKATRIHRDNLDPTGEKQAEGAKEMAGNPLFNVITTKDGGAFASEGAAERELRRRGLQETHEIVPASEVSARSSGFVVRRAEASEQQQPEPAAAEASTTTAEAPAADAVTADQPKAETSDRFANNKLFTADKVAAARARMKAKLGTLNSGIDPELLVDGMTIAGAYIESGIRNFTQYAKTMIEDMGDGVKPYLLSFWEGARNYPGLDTKDMTSAEESRREFDALLTPEDLKTDAVGEIAEKPKKRSRKSGEKGDMVLTQDWGVETIDGYGDVAREAGNDTKDAFLKEARNYLNAVADQLRAFGFEPHADGKGKPSKPVRSNEAGAAVSGDVSLTMRNAETGQNVYIHIGDTPLRGSVPVTPSGIAVMFRTGNTENEFVTGGTNQWAPVDLSAKDLAQLVNESAAANKPARVAAQQEKRKNEPAADGAQDQGRAEAVRGGRGDTQPGSASADSGNVAPRQPEDGRPAGEAGDSGRSGVRVPGADVARGEGQPQGRASGDGRARAGGAGSPDAGAGGAGSAGDLGGVSSPAATSAQAQDLHVDNPLEIVGGSPVQRFNRNRAAIELLQALTEEGRQATPDEQKVLAGYIGWGSFGQELFQGSWERPVYKDEGIWKERGQWLRDTLGESAWKSAQRSITNAHYTDPPTVLAMWDMVRRMGFEGGKVLEPSMGTGNFFSMMPADLKARSQLTGIELDETTGAIAKQLFPRSNVRIMGYQDSKTPDGFYDLVIGNWPFENTPVADRRYNKLNPMLHDYFFLKTMDQVRPGGIVIGITSAGSMDKQNTAIRRELAKQAELVSAIRLPSGAFEEYAGTKVVTDIVILRKRPQRLVATPSDATWVETGDYKTPAGETIKVNRYYLDNPQNIIGTLDFGSGTTTFRAGMIVRRPDNMAEQLQKAIEMVPQGAMLPRGKVDHLTYYANETGERHGALALVNDRLMIAVGDQLVEANEARKYALKDAKKTAVREQQLRAAIDLRKKHAALVDAERGGRPADDARKALRGAYDAFVKAHGGLRDSFALEYLERINDPFFAELAALENDDGTPAAIMERSTTRGRRTLDNPSVRDAYVLARNQSVNPSVAEVARLAGKPEQAVKAELMDSGAVFEAPNGDVVPSDIYLSGNVRQKLREAQAALDDGNTAMRVNVAALKEVMPEDVPYFNIETQFGATWVPNEAYAQYIAHMLGQSSPKGIEVSFRAGRWKVKMESGLSRIPEAVANYGTPGYPFSRLVQAAISNQVLRLTSKDENGNDVYDAERTEEANARIAKIREDFGAWLWSDPERRQDLEREYNEARNAWATPTYDGSFLTFEGMALTLGNGAFQLRQHQVNAIWRAIVNRRSINAHEVGTGKTFTMGGIAVESRRYGIAKKPMLLAHNANSATVAAEIRMMYPSARVLYVDNLQGDKKEIRLRQIANDDWDVIVVPHSLISNLALREETMMRMAEDDIKALEAEFFDAAREDNINPETIDLDDDEDIAKIRSVTAKELAKARKRIIENIKKQAQKSSKEGAIAFEDLGVDMILVDEVHEFKKPPIVTRMKMKGLNTQISNRSIALQFLTRYVRQMNNGGNVHTFTGTPITNTITEIYHQMRYVMEAEMEQATIADWDGWFGSFAAEVQDVELTAAGDYEMVSRLAGFVNVPELRAMVGQYMDTVFAEDMPEMRPRKVNGKEFSDPALTEAERAELLNGRTEGAKDRPYKKVINDSADMTAEQMRIFSRLQQYAREWRAATGKQKKEWMRAGDPRSPIITEGIANKASFDVRLLDDEGFAGQEGRVPDEPTSKASRVVKNVLEIYNSHPNANQVIFSENGFGKRATRSAGVHDGEKQKFTVPVFAPMHDIVERLVQGGIPREQIAIVDGSTSKERRKEIAEAMNSSKIRIVIGSTDTLGVGVNMQRNLRAMHHVDAPYMPGELEQRNGRGLRQGNQWNTVLEYRYMTDRLDGKRWQILAVKQRFINAFMKAAAGTRVIEGEAAADEQSDILESFSEAAGDPRILQRVKMQKKLETLHRKERMYTQGIADMRRQERISAELADRLTRELKQLADSRTRANVDALIASQQQAFAATIDGTTYDTRKDAADALQAFIEANVRIGDSMKTVGEYAGHPLRIEWPRHMDAPVTQIDAFGQEFAGKGIAGAEAKMRNFPSVIENKTKRRDMERSTAENMRAAMNQPFAQAADLERITKQLQDLEKDLEINPVPPPAWLRQGAPIDSEVHRNKRPYIVTGHRYSKEGWFVIAEDDKGTILIPYMEATDEVGMPLYEERAFVPPVVIEKDGAAAAGESADVVVDRAAQSAATNPLRNADGTFARQDQAGDSLAFSATLPRDRNAVRIGITEKGLVRAMRLQFDGLAEVTSKLLERGRSGKRGGVIVVGTADNAEIGRIVAERTGRKLDSTMRKFSSAGRLNGFYDPKTGLTFLVGPNLNPVTATAVMLHEMMHGQQRQKIDARALEMVRNRHSLKDEDLRAFLDRVMLRMIGAGEVGNAAEASAYIVEQAVIEGRSAGYTFADNAFMQWVDAKIGKRVGDFLRSFAGMIRTWMLRNGLGAKTMTVDDFVGYAMAGLERAVAGEVRGRAKVASMSSMKGRVTAGWTPDRITRLLREFAYGMDATRTKAYAAWVSPEDFLSATTPANDRDQLESERRPLDAQDLTNETQPIFLEVQATEDDEGTFRIVGHEGRHRMMALRDAGVRSVPVVLRLRDTKYDAQAIDEPYFMAQRYVDKTKGAKGFYARGAHPLSYANEQALREDFGAESDVQFSRSVGDARGRANAQASIGARAPQSEAFRRWFRDSKVVDENGQPLVVYHGTPVGGIVSFDPEKSSDIANGGIWFTDDQRQAARYADPDNRGRGEIVEVYVSLQNPLVVDAMEEARAVADVAGVDQPEMWEDAASILQYGDWSRDLVDQARNSGHDGLMILNVGDADTIGKYLATHVVAFRPNQIKSATGNRGTFDPDNDDIRFSRSVGDAPAQEAQRVQSAIEGKTLIEAAQFLTRSKDGAKAAVAQKVLEKLQRLEKAGVALDLKIVHRGDMAPASMVNARGYTETGFDAKGRDIVVWLNGADVTGKVGTEEEVLLHELVHAATAGMVFYGTQTPDSLAGKHARDLMAVTDAIAEHIRTRFDAADAGKATLTEFEQDMREGANNAFRSDDEVLAWALSSGEAQAYLETIPYRSGSMWSNFVQAVRNLLGLGARNDTALSEVLRVAERILTDDAPNAGRAAFWHKRNIRMAQQQVRGSIAQTAERGDEDLQFSRSGMRALASRATTELNNALTAPGKLSWWHKTIGTMYNLAERSPTFKPVFQAAQGFIDDVSHYAADAAERAPKLLPRLDTWRDILTSPISAEDNKAVGKPIFEGTLSWTRDAEGRPVRVDALTEAAAGMTVEAMARELVSRGALEERTLRMWRGMPDAQFESAIRTRYENSFLQAGIVWTDDELASMFSLTPAQIALYREFRAAVDRSLDTMARADMLRFAGEDVRFLRDPVMEAETLREAASLIVMNLSEQANAQPDRAEQFMATSQGVMDRMEKVLKLQATGYAPLSRFGKYTVDVVVDGNREYFGLFETAREANKMAERMRAEFGAGTVTQGTLSDEAFRLFAGITPESLEIFGNMLGLDSTGDDAQDRAFQEYLRLTKTNRSALRRLIHRKGIAGFSEDVGRVLASFAYSNARQTAAGLHMGDLSQAVSDIPKEQGELKDVAVKLSEYIKNPQEEAQAIRGLLFAQYLGGSVASAFVNMTQPAAVTFPWLSQHGGAKLAAAEISKAAKHIATRGHRYEEGLAEALKVAEEDGVVSPQEVHQLMAQARGSGSLKAGDGTRVGNALALASNSVTRLSAAWGKLFSAAEQLNRRITFIAAYRVASQQRMANPAEFARRAVTETQFVYSKASKMQWGRGAVGGTLMTFKTYSVAYMELMSRLWSQGAPGSAERKSGRKAVALMLAMVLLMGGGGGLPFMEDAEDLIDGIAQIAGYNVSTKKARQQFLIDTFGADAADFIERGVSGLPGVPLDVSGRLGLGNLIPGTGIFLDRSNHTRDILELLGPVGDLGNRIVTGARKALSGDVGGAALEVSPVAVRNVAKGVDMAVMDQYRDARGRKVLDTTDLEAALKSVGFQPASVAKVQDANYLNQRAKDFYSLSADRISAMWAAGIYEKDSDKVQEARDMIAQWNEDNPDQPMMIRMPNILRRVREMGKDKAQRIADTAPRAMRQQLREELMRQ